MAKGKKTKKAKRALGPPHGRRPAGLTAADMQATLGLAWICAVLTLIAIVGVIALWWYATATRGRIHLPPLVVGLPVLTAGLGIVALWQWRAGLRILRKPPEGQK